MRQSRCSNHAFAISVLGIPHPAVATRDVGLYQPFRNALRSTQVVGLPTLMWQLMRRRVQESKQCCVCPNSIIAFLFTSLDTDLLFPGSIDQSHSSKMRVLRWTCIDPTRLSGKRLYRPVTGLPTCLQARSRVAICDACCPQVEVFLVVERLINFRVHSSS